VQTELIEQLTAVDDAVVQAQLHRAIVETGASITALRENVRTMAAGARPGGRAAGSGGGEVAMMMLEQLDRAVEDDPDHMAGEVPPLSSPSHGASHRRVARAVAPRTTRSEAAATAAAPPARLSPAPEPEPLGPRELGSLAELLPDASPSPVGKFG
jgi:hypothetical protein